MAYTDFIGQTVDIGDYIYYVRRTGGEGIVLQIERFTPTGMPVGKIVKHEGYDNRRGQSARSHTNFVKVPRESIIIWKLSHE